MNTLVDVIDLPRELAVLQNARTLYPEQAPHIAGLLLEVIPDSTEGYGDLVNAVVGIIHDRAASHPVVAQRLAQVLSDRLTARAIRDPHAARESSSSCIKIFNDFSALVFPLKGQKPHDALCALVESQAELPFFFGSLAQLQAKVAQEVGGSSPSPERSKLVRAVGVLNTPL